MKKIVPYSLIAFRFITAPIMIYLAYTGGTTYKAVIILLLYLGLASDIFDGIIARQLGVADTKLRRLDSQTDLVFWLSIGYTSWLLHPEIILEFKIPVIILFATEATCYIVSFIRFGKETCTHAWLSKSFGLTMLGAFTSLIYFGNSSFFFIFAFIVGYVSHLDRILITLIIPEWTHDIPSTYHAILLRKGKTIKRYKLFN